MDLVSIHARFNPRPKGRRSRLPRSFTAAGIVAANPIDLIFRDPEAIGITLGSLTRTDRNPELRAEHGRT
jgi:hypothetical protein